MWLALPIVLWVLPSDYFHQGSVWCPSKLIWNWDCPFCGLIRATQHAMHLEWKAAWEFNKMIVGFFPVCVFLWLYVCRRLWTMKPHQQIVSNKK
jgi:hypothetical protein